VKRCIEDDPGLAGIETWMRSLGDGWEPILLAQQKAMFPHLCEDFPDETPETLGWIGCACWQRDDAGQVRCAR
jgi:hypothetical protein